MSEAEFEQLISLAPILIISFFVGVASFFTQQEKEVDRAEMIKNLLKQVLLSIVLCVIVYSILSATDLPYLAKIGISCAVGFFGIDKALSIVQSILNLKSPNPKNEKGEK